MEATNLADLYNAPLLDWRSIEARLAQGLSQAPETEGPNRHTCWSATIRQDGRSHITAVGALWVDGAFWFGTGERTQRARNLAGGPVRVDESGCALTAEYSAPSAGPPPWYVYRLAPDNATALLVVPPGRATRWRF